MNSPTPPALRGAETRGVDQVICYGRVEINGLITNSRFPYSNKTEMEMNLV